MARNKNYYLQYLDKKLEKENKHLKLQQVNQDRLDRSIERSLNRERAVYGFSIFKIVLLILLMVSLFRSFSGSTTYLSFTGFLNSLSRTSQVDMSWALSFNQSAGSAVLDVPIFGKFLYFLVSIISVLLYAVGGVYNVISFVVQILGFMFVF